MIEAVLSCLIGITVIISALLLCAGCRETKNPEKECNGDASLLHHHGSDREKAVNCPDKIEINHVLKDGSLSRMSSVSSHASVRITLTNAEIDDDIESPVSNVSSCMADRQLPELPRYQDEEDEDHDYDTVENLPSKKWIRYQPPEECPEYDTLDVMNRSEADYYTLGDVGEILDKPEYARVDKAEYATVDMQPEYATVDKKPEYASVDHLQDYPDISDTGPAVTAKKASYEVLPDDFIQRTEQRIISPRPFSEGFLPSDLEHLSSVIDKNRAGSERKARDNEDSMSVIYAIINPEFRKQKLSEEEQHYSTVSNEENVPPLPENPYAMLDNLLADLKIPEPEPGAVHEDLENLRPTSTNIDGTELIQRKVNPIIANSSPFAIVNPSRTASQITYVEDEIL